MRLVFLTLAAALIAPGACAVGMTAGGDNDHAAAAPLAAGRTVPPRRVRFNCIPTQVWKCGSAPDANRRGDAMRPTIREPAIDRSRVEALRRWSESSGT